MSSSFCFHSYKASKFDLKWMGWYDGVCNRAAFWWFTCGVCCPCHRGQIVKHLCCSPSVNWVHLREHVIGHRWIDVHFCRPFSVPMQAQWILDAFVSTEIKMRNSWNNSYLPRIAHCCYYLRFCLASTNTVWLVEYFYVRINRLFGKFLLLVRHTSWWQLGNVEHSPSTGNLCHALEFSLPNRVPICWPIYTKRCHPSRCLRIDRLELSRPIQRRSSPRLLSLDPCCVATIWQN